VSRAIGRAPSRDDGGAQHTEDGKGEDEQPNAGRRLLLATPAALQK
jgi:hypothetical protein